MDQMKHTCIYGDRVAWPSDTGQVAILNHFIGSINHYEQDEINELGVNFVPFAVPRADNVETLNKPAYIDFASISSGHRKYMN